MFVLKAEFFIRKDILYKYETTHREKQEHSYSSDIWSKENLQTFAGESADRNRTEKIYWLIMDETTRKKVYCRVFGSTPRTVNNVIQCLWSTQKPSFVLNSFPCSRLELFLSFISSFIFVFKSHEIIPYRPFSFMFVHHFFLFLCCCFSYFVSPLNLMNSFIHFYFALRSSFLGFLFHFLFAAAVVVVVVVCLFVILSFFSSLSLVSLCVYSYCFLFFFFSFLSL